MFALLQACYDRAGPEAGSLDLIEISSCMCAFWRPVPLECDTAPTWFTQSNPQIKNFPHALFRSQAVWRLRGRERVPSGGLASDAHPGRDSPLSAQAVLLLQLRPTAQALRTPQRGVVSTGGAVGDQIGKMSWISCWSLYSTLITLFTTDNPVALTVFYW